MRAYLKAAPGAGAGYGVLEILDIGEADIGSVMIWRLADGKTLAQGGWRTGRHAITPRRLQFDNNRALLWFGPEVIDEIDQNENYELELPGCGKMPLWLCGVYQSEIVTENGAGAWPPPPQDQPLDPEQESRVIYEGVEQTPVDASAADVNDLPSGVAAIPDAEPDNKKRRGCALLACAIFVIWAAGAWLLWHWSINAPMPPEDEKPAPFELMPRAEGS